MTYKINFTSDKKQAIILDDYRVDGPMGLQQHTSLTLFGKGSSDYGQELWTNLVHMLENHCNSVPPSQPIEGQIWYRDTNFGTLRLYKKKYPGSEVYEWVDVIDDNTLKTKLADPSYQSRSTLPTKVKLDRDGTVFTGDLTLVGDLWVRGYLYVDRDPIYDNSVITLKYLNDKLSGINKLYVPLIGNSQIVGDITLHGELVVGTVITTKEVVDITNDKEFVSKEYVDSTILNKGITLPTKNVDTALVTNGADLQFSKICMQHICQQTTVPSNNTPYNVIRSNNTTVSWINLDTDYVTLATAQEITGKKKFGAVDITKELSVSGNIGTANQVLTSRGANLSPQWKSINDLTSGSGSGSLPTNAKGVLVNNGTSTSWSDGSANQILSTLGNGSFQWISQTFGIGNNYISNDSVDVGADKLFTSVNGLDSYQEPIIPNYSRGYIKLSDKLIVQWINGIGIGPVNIAYMWQETAKAIRSQTRVSHVRSNMTNLTSDVTNFSYVGLSDKDILLKYKFEVPFTKVFTSLVSTSIASRVPNSSNKGVVMPDAIADGVAGMDCFYQIFDPASSNSHCAVVFQWTGSGTDVKLAPTIIAFGTY